MQFKPLGHTGINLPEICLGTMTFGEQNTQQEAFEQLNYALEHGLYFWDTAEMYSVPPKPETYGATETILGNWFAQHGQRDKVFLASKIAGPDFGEHIFEKAIPSLIVNIFHKQLMALSNAYKLIILIFINYIGLNAIPTSLERSLMVISKLKMIMTLLP